MTIDRCCHSRFTYAATDTRVHAKKRAHHPPSPMDSRGRRRATPPFPTKEHATKRNRARRHAHSHLRRYPRLPPPPRPLTSLTPRPSVPTACVSAQGCEAGSAATRRGSPPPDTCGQRPAAARRDVEGRAAVRSGAGWTGRTVSLVAGRTGVPLAIKTAWWTRPQGKSALLSRIGPPCPGKRCTAP